MRSLLSLLSPIWAAGCGAAADPSYAPPVFTVGGVVRSGAVTAPHDYHVSLLWWSQQLETPTGGVGNVAQDVTVTPQEGLSYYQLSISELPSGEALLEPNLARGVIVAWSDGNGNGQLDAVPEGQTRSVDRILGQSETTILFESGLAEPFPGFTILDQSQPPALPAGCDSWDACFVHPIAPVPPPPGSILPPGSTLSFDLDGPGVETDQLWCPPARLVPAKPPSSTAPPGSLGDCTLPDVPAGGLHARCFGGTNRIFVAYACTDPANVCWVECPLAYYWCPSAQPLPSDWPCQ